MNSESNHPPIAAKDGQVDLSPIPLLETIQRHGKTWSELAPRYGVTSPDPPWKISLYAMCECLSAGGTLPSLERRHTEDRLGETLYRETPGPEQQLLALAHAMLDRGLLSEQDLVHRMKDVRSRMEAS